MEQTAAFMEALRAAVPTQPSPRLGTALVPRLAATARASTLEAETRAMRRSAAPRAGVARRPRSRRLLVAQVAIAIALIPLVLAGLAVAGVTVPSPARSAFNSLGIHLPNQPSKESEASSSEPSSSEPSSQPATEGTKGAETQPAPAKGNSKAAHEHAREQRNKAKGKAVGHDRGKAVGLNETAPPGQTGQTGPPSHSNAGGNGRGSSSGQGASKAPKAPHAPNGVAKGHSKTPPGKTKVPPGQAKK